MAESFYCPELPAEGLVELTGNEAHHLLHVSRHGIGDEVILFDGEGSSVTARVESASKKLVTCSIVKTLNVQPPEDGTSTLLIASALPKGDRASFMIEKLTELGVMSFLPLRTSRSVVHGGENKTEKLKQKVIEACKQCGRNRLMKVEEMLDWATFLKTYSTGQRYLAQPGAAAFAPVSSKELMVLAVGPEGGFSPEEEAAAMTAGFQPLTLGNHILRIETAAMAGAVLLQQNVTS